MQCPMFMVASYAKLSYKVGGVGMGRGQCVNSGGCFVLAYVCMYVYMHIFVFHKVSSFECCV